VYTAAGGVAVEPMTCPPDALNSQEGLIVLEPGASFTGRWGLCSPRQEEER
jgi:aldose 1-epimerase